MCWSLMDVDNALCPIVVNNLTTHFDLHCESKARISVAFSNISNIIIWTNDNDYRIARKCSVVVCAVTYLTVCLSVSNDVNFEFLDLQRLFSVCGYILMVSGSRSHNVIGSKSKSQEQKEICLYVLFAGCERQSC